MLEMMFQMRFVQVSVDGFFNIVNASSPNAEPGSGVVIEGQLFVKKMTHPRLGEIVAIHAMNSGSKFAVLGLQEGCLPTYRDMSSN